MQRRCLCRCHFALGERERADGVSVTDAIAAVSACALCQNHHVAALSDSPANDNPRIDGGSVELRLDLSPPEWTSEEGG